jgi:hypothetical protein
MVELSEVSDRLPCEREGQRLYYNFIRENQRLEGRTPAEMVGLYQASVENRWMELLKKLL